MGVPQKVLQAPHPPLGQHVSVYMAPSLPNGCSRCCCSKLTPRDTHPILGSYGIIVSVRNRWRGGGRGCTLLVLPPSPPLCLTTTIPSNRTLQELCLSFDEGVPEHTHAQTFIQRAK